MSLNEARQHYIDYFTDKIETHGATPQGVDYSSAAAQDIRFEQLVKLISPGQTFSVIDYGCGYGALYDFLSRKGWNFSYSGLDMIPSMVRVAADAHAGVPGAHFTADESELPTADYVLACGIFNNRFEADADDWTRMVVSTLERMDHFCTRGFAFNMLTKYSDADRMAERPDLYFADPLLFFDFCKRYFSRNVALIHDYGLYDFTILVRKTL